MANPSLTECRKAFGLAGDYDKEDVAKKYRSLAMKTHPDKGGDNETFARITLMRDVLIENIGGQGNVHSREAGEYSHFTSRDFDFSFFHEMFKESVSSAFTQSSYTRSSYNPPPRIIEKDLSLDAVIISRSVKREIIVDEWERCNNCHGRGSSDVRNRKGCDVCNSRGTVNGHSCTKCFGNGFVYVRPCENCGGRGTVLVRRTGSLQLDPLTIPGKVALGDNIYCRLVLSDKSDNGMWFRNGMDLHYRYDMSVFDVLLQKEIGWLDRLSGREFKISFKKSYEEGIKMRLPNMGLVPEGGKSRGDLILHIRAIYPEKSEALEILKILKDMI